MTLYRTESSPGQMGPEDPRRGSTQGKLPLDDKDSAIKGQSMFNPQCQCATFNLDLQLLQGPDQTSSPLSVSALRQSCTKQYCTVCNNYHLIDGGNYYCGLSARGV